MADHKVVWYYNEINEHATVNEKHGCMVINNIHIFDEVDINFLH